MFSKDFINFLNYGSEKKNKNEKDKYVDSSTKPMVYIILSNSKK